MIWLSGFLLLWSPGFLLARALRLSRTGLSGVDLAIHLALGLAFWPLLLYATSSAGLHWTPLAGRVAALAIIVAAAALALRGLRRRRLALRAQAAIPLGALAALTVANRWSHIRDLSFPPWVDSLHHAMIVRLIAEQGAIPNSLEPFAAGSSFYYHWGYHASAAWLTWLLGLDSPLAIPRLLLDYGQMLNAATIITMYAAGRVLLKSREAGWIAAALACFISLYPAYYLSWGRYTHLAGTLMLPALLIVLWRLTTSMTTSSRVLRTGAGAVILTAGLALVHVRIAFFAAVFMLVLAATRAWRRDWRSIGRWLAVGAVAGILVLPWFLHVVNDPAVRSFVRPTQTGSPDVHQTVPLTTLWSRNNRELLSLATCGITGLAGFLEMPPLGRVLSGAWWLLLIWAGRFPPKDARARRLLPWHRISLIGAFCAVTWGLLYLRLPWLDLTRFASVSSAAITLFIPLSLSGAALIPWFLQRTVGGKRASWIAAAIALGLALYGTVTMSRIVNPVTLIAGTADARALAWIESNVDRNARFAVDARTWMAPSWVGVDGGYWIGPATSATSILPPSIYAWSMPAPAVEEVNRKLLLWSQRDPRAWELLRRDGVTHVYTGARSATAACPTLIRDPRLRLLHRDGPACVFAVEYSPAPGL